MTKLGPVIKRISQISSIIRLLLVLKLLLGAYRHVYAYGILGTGQQIYTAIKNVRAGPVHASRSLHAHAPALVVQILSGNR